MTGGGGESDRQDIEAPFGGRAYEWNLLSDRIEWSGKGADERLAWLSTLPSGKALKERIPPTDLTTRLEAVARAFRHDGQFECDYALVNDDGTSAVVRDSGAVEFSETGMPVSVRGVIRPRHLADALDNAPAPARANALAIGVESELDRLREVLNLAIYNARREAVDGAYLVVGIDKLAMLNQAFGYEAADAVINAVGRRIRECVRSGDVIGHVGGDSFGLVLERCSGAELDSLANRILDRAHANVIDTPAGPIHVTVSIGATSFPTEVQSTQEIMTKADFALRMAKDTGRDRIVHYTLSNTELDRHRRTMSLAQEVHRALRSDQLIFAYQPIVDCMTLAPRHYECLLRLKRGDGDIVVARDFMPVVEALGMTRRIDQAVLHMAVEQMSSVPDARLAINVSAVTPSDSTWREAAQSLLRGNPGIASRLTVEITETQKLEIAACRGFVSTLRDLGCRVALDDFGAGHTSFLHLKELPVNVLKVDAAFVRNVHRDSGNRAFVRAVLDLAQSFGLETVAEGVEAMEEVRVLRAEGADLLQGFVLGMPSVVAPWRAAKALPAADTATVNANAASGAER